MAKNVVIVLLTLAALMAGGSRLYAQPCSDTGFVQREGGQTLICDGSNWHIANDIETTGRQSLQIANDSGGCNTDKTGRLRYNDSSDIWQYCNGTTWATLRYPECADDDSVECHLPASRNTANPDFVASNILDGVNILGVTGSYSFTPCNVIWDSFTDLVSQQQTTLVTSQPREIITASCSVEVSISGDGAPEYRICSSSDCSTVIQNWTSGTSSISDGQFLQARLTTAGASNTNHTATVLVGTAGTEWRARTSGVPEYVALETSTSGGGTVYLSIDKPTGTVENDLMIAVMARDDDDCPMSAPAGWTTLREGSTAGDIRNGIWYKVATVSEPTSYDFYSCSDNESVVGTVLTFRGAHTSTPIHMNATANGDSPAASAPSMTTTLNNTLLLAVLQTEVAGTATPPTDYVELVDIRAGSGTAGAGLAVAARAFPFAGSTGAALFSNDDDVWRAEHIAIRSDQ